MNVRYITSVLPAAVALAVAAAGCSDAAVGGPTSLSASNAPVQVTLRQGSASTFLASISSIAADPPDGSMGGGQISSSSIDSLNIVVTAIAFRAVESDTGVEADTDSVADSTEHGDSVSAEHDSTSDSTEASDSTEHGDSVSAEHADSDAAEHAEDEGESSWVTVMLDQPDTVDLMALPTDSSQAIVLAEGVVPVGKYYGVRLLVNGGWVTFSTPIQLEHAPMLKADTAYALTIPSGAQSGIKTNVSFTVSADSTGAANAVHLLFDPTELTAHLVVTGNGKIILSPVLHARGEHD